MKRPGSKSSTRTNSYKCEQIDLETKKKRGHKYDWFTSQPCVCKRCGHMRDAIDPMRGEVRIKPYGDKISFRRTDPRNKL